MGTPVCGIYRAYIANIPLSGVWGQPQSDTCLWGAGGMPCAPACGPKVQCVGGLGGHGCWHMPVLHQGGWAHIDFKFCYGAWSAQKVAARHKGPCKSCRRDVPSIWIFDSETHVATVQMVGSNLGSLYCMCADGAMLFLAIKTSCEAAVRGLKMPAWPECCGGFQFCSGTCK